MPSHAVRQPNDRERAVRAVALRVEGKTYREIAEALGWGDESSARYAVTRLLDRTEAEGIAELRAVETQRLDQLHAAYWSKALAGDIDAFKAVLSVHDRRSRLLGLAAAPPISTVSDAEMAEVLSALLADPDLRGEAAKWVRHHQPRPVIDGEVIDPNAPWADE